MTNAPGTFAAADAPGGKGVIAHYHAIAAMGNINACRIVLDGGRVVAAVEAP